MEKTNKKPIAIVLTDTHLREDNYDVNASIYKQAEALADRLGVRTIIHGADVFDARKAQPLDNLKAFDNIVNQFTKQWFFITGNHDKTDYYSENSYLDQYRYHPNIQLTRDFNVKNFGNGVYIGMLPYFGEKNPDKYLSYLEKIKKMMNAEKPSVKILITHIAVNGVKNNDGSLVENSITPSLFKEFDTVLVGHYHNRSKIGKNIHYIGSAFQHNYGEDVNKGFTIIYSDASIEYVDAEFPKYYVFKKRIEDVDSKVFNELKELKEDGNNIRLELMGPENQIRAFSKENLKGIDVKLKEDEIEDAIDYASNTKFETYSISDIKQEHEVFCVANKIAEEKVQKQNEYLEAIK